MRMLWGLVVAFVLAGGAARADVAYSLEGVTFADGGTATGYVTVNVYGYVSAFDIVTSPTTGAFASGYEYVSGVNPSNVGAGFTLATFSRVNYIGALSFLLPIDLTTAPSLEPIVIGSHSFECNTYLLGDGTCTAGNERLVTGGVLIPEPASLAVLGAGLAFVGLRLRRRTG